MRLRRATHLIHAAIGGRGARGERLALFDTFDARKVSVTVKFGTGVTTNAALRAELMPKTFARFSSFASDDLLLRLPNEIVPPLKLIRFLCASDAHPTAPRIAHRVFLCVRARGEVEVNAGLIHFNRRQVRVASITRRATRRAAATFPRREERRDPVQTGFVRRRRRRAAV
jgi:hypothetical protein